MSVPSQENLIGQSQTVTFSRVPAQEVPQKTRKRPSAKVEGGTFAKIPIEYRPPPSFVRLAENLPPQAVELFLLLLPKLD
jgi:hypothetical protein